MKILKLAVLALWVMVVPVRAYAGAMTGGATEWTQIANNIQLTASYAEQAQQTIHQLNMYQTMLKNLEKMTPNAMLNSAAQKLWNDQNMTGKFRNLYTIVSNGQKISLSAQNLDTTMKQLHPGYGNFNGYDFTTALKNWSDSSRNAVNGALQYTSVEADDLMTEGDMVSQLQNQAASADGQMQALKAGNDIGVAMVGQMQKLRQIELAQMQAQNTVQMSEQGRRDASDASLQRFLDSAKSVIMPNSSKHKDLF